MYLVSNQDHVAQKSLQSKLNSSHFWRQELLLEEGMKEPILVIMAAGLGSRYGGLKQVDPIGSQGELIIDFSVFDSIRAGFKRVIFVINRDNENVFKERIGNRISRFIQVEYAYQDIYDLPDPWEVPAGRTKPWGTAHAIYAARKLIDSSFVVINADDYYGKDAFIKIYQFLIESSFDETQCAMVGYQVKNTVTEHGSVSRGVCEVDSAMNLCNVVEKVHIEKKNDKVVYYENGAWFDLKSDQIVSMNFWGFKLSFIKEIERLLPEFLAIAMKENPLKSEFFVTYVVTEMIRSQKATLKVFESVDQWYGVTYKEDKEALVTAMQVLKENGAYPMRLWEE